MMVCSIINCALHKKCFVFFGSFFFARFEKSSYLCTQSRGLDNKMTTEEKAKDIVRKWYHDNAPDTAYRAAIQMANWKEKQMIDKACEWLREYTDDYIVRDTDESWLREGDFIRDFTKAMEG